jgi:predicted ribosomally synthesized peptide with nif11-like leader
MSNSALQGFRTKLAHDEELRARLAHALSGGGAKDKASVDELVAFARTCGYDFSARELLSGGELSDEQLDVVAAGGDPDVFDCSELVQWASGGPGVRLGGISAAMMSGGTLGKPR